MGSRFVMDKAVLKERREAAARAQAFIDRACVQEMTIYVPAALPRYKHAGKLRDSVRIPEPGKIVYTAAFAKREYYGVFNHTNSGNPGAKRLWFEVMKKRKKEAIRQEAARIIGGKKA